MTQEQALSILKSGGNVFLTGEPGSGKTHTIREYVAYLKARGVEPAITASTGIAATHIGGFTIHSWSGIGIKKELTPYDIDRIAENERLSKRIARASVLIIDEVSMLSAAVLSMVDAVCRELRRSSEPFGGLQVVLVGDFFQLPPVEKQGESTVNRNAALYYSDPPDAPASRFAYEGAAWRALNPLVCYLSEQHRQEDEAFLAILAALRRGQAGEAERTALLARVHDRDALDHEAYENTTKLYAHNADVDRLNAEALSRIESGVERFSMEGSGPGALVEQLKRGCLSPETLELKVGARVMFTKNNFDKDYVNGTTGTVMDFSPEGYPVVATARGEVVAEPAEWAIEAEGRVLARIIQIPLRLAWAMTVHKSQGMSLDRAMIDLSRAFEYGQGYVALSRVRTLEGLSLLGLNDRALEVHPDVLRKDSAFREHSAAAQASFASLDDDELIGMHQQFLRAIGGSLKPIVKISDADSSTSPTSKASRAAERKDKLLEHTLALVLEGQSLEDVAQQRERAVGTILEHLETLKERGKLPFEGLRHLVDEASLTDIEEAFAALGAERLRPIYDRLEGRYSFETIRAARLLQ